MSSGKIFASVSPCLCVKMPAEAFSVINDLCQQGKIHHVFADSLEKSVRSNSTIYR